MNIPRITVVYSVGIHSQHLHVHFTKVQCRTNSFKLYDVDYAQVISWKTKIHGIFKQNYNLQYLHTSPANSTIQHWFWLSNHSLISQATPSTDKACVTNLSLEERQVVEKKTRKFCFVVYAAILQILTCTCSMLSANPHTVCVWGAGALRRCLFRDKMIAVLAHSYWFSVHR